MKKLIIRADATWQEIDERVNGISKRAHEINQMFDKKEALKKFRILRDLVNSDRHELWKSRNHEIVNGCAPLYHYSGYGEHINYTRPYNIANLNTNLDEFDQAKDWYYVFNSRKG
ncbi:hypothetical protein [Levilactobacillus tujiorum]|uniref:Uncharacterized protein n=1 Tax=Levilactobacillus tujiorum TaxID=2912243 RepID=A0ABX1L5S1_9LACO|nr:hypothetical protein [Levilactobacillus tujiorum]MCH5464246.1 hypothetical protein [Levilactobacillus tujiorum]NLR11320.1 hypothetical protein [Lactobacillus sp. HBUAS51387]NLR29227.1 hypothetical protein [Levilactobacillus tujiorum]